MTHVQIKLAPTGGSIVVDGHDISEHVLRGGLSIDVSPSPETPSTVKIRLKADALELDLPDAVLELLQSEVPA